MATVVLLSQFSVVQEWVVDFLTSRGVRRVGFIVDAKKPRLEVNPEYVFVDKEVFEGAGLEVAMVDLEEAEDLEGVLGGVDVVYVKGGNSFYLLQAMRRSGFDVLVEKLLDRGVIYVGESAGAYVACPTIEMAGWKHQDRNIVGLEDLTGLGLVPFLVSAHYDESLRDVLRPYIEESEYEVRLLGDDELIVSDGGVIREIRI